MSDARPSPFVRKTIVSVFIFLVCGVGWWATHRVGPDISGTEARALIQSDGAVLVDVRTPAEFGLGHLEGALNVDYLSLRDGVGPLPPKDQPIIVYCLSGARAARAQAKLRMVGFRNVRNLGAIWNW